MAKDQTLAVLQPGRARVSRVGDQGGFFVLYMVTRVGHLASK